jgi:hypothetical protein
MLQARVLAACLVAALGSAAACSNGGVDAHDTSGPGPSAGSSGASSSAGSVSGGSAGASSAAGSAASGAGTAGSGGATGGAGGLAVPPAKPTLVGSEWAFTLGEVTLQVDPQQGGRITTFKLGAENLLTGPDVNPTYWGSTLWIAPEATLWTHPPPAVIDTDPYTATASDSTLTLSSMTYDELGVSATKVFSTDAARGAFTVEYRLNNTSQAAVMMSPWEVTRVLPRGLTFFPKGPSQRLSPDATLPTTESNGVVWYSYDMNAVTNDSKLWADASEGWIAHVAAGLVFIKTFSDLSAEQIAPMEGDVELYTNEAHTYIELENLGPYVSIAPGASASWTVTWYLRRLPAALEATAGSMALAQFVRETIE